MLAPSWEAIADSSEEDFNRSVDSIMKCEDFKSNFARRLSNRYISRSPISVSKQDTVLKLRPTNNCQDIQSHAPERIEVCTQLSKGNIEEHNGEATKPPAKQHKMNVDIRTTEINVLNMEVDTLRWQLAQTEANRQMHIALLKQIVTFLNRVKQHFEGQRAEEASRKSVPNRALARSLNFNDLPRSRSVLHVNKNVEYAITPAKKMSTRKISKSISNVNGYKDCNGHWNQSKLSLVPEHETSQKISEEMSRLITLANTVLSTKLPDLACACPDKNNDANMKSAEDEEGRPLSLNLSSVAINFDKEEMRNSIADDPRTFNDIMDKMTEVNALHNDKHFDCPSPNLIEHKQEITDIKVEKKEADDVKSGKESPNTKVTLAIEKLNDYNAVSNFIEDESGFSSMSSFQEIGIPIISIIPPSPCKEVGYLDEAPIVPDEAEKWKSDAIQLDKHSVKVFWV